MRVFVLPGAKQDIRALRRYISRQFGHQVWLESYQKLRETFATLVQFPSSGELLEELLAYGAIEYRRATSGMNQVVYSLQDEVLYVHLVSDSRRDMKALLARRLLHK